MLQNENCFFFLNIHAKQYQYVHIFSDLPSSFVTSFKPGFYLMIFISCLYLIPLGSVLLNYPGVHMNTQDCSWGHTRVHSSKKRCALVVTILLKRNDI